MSRPGTRPRRCRSHARRRAFTIIELLVVVSIIALLLGVLMPAVSKARDQAKLAGSVSNLRNLGTAHATYAAAHADRQVTFYDDNITSYGDRSCDAFPEFAQRWGRGTHPNLVLGWGPETIAPGAPKVLYQYYLDGTTPGHECWAGNPINLWGSLFGPFRFGHQTRTFSPYLTGRYYDPVFFAPKDRYLLEIVRDGFESPAEFALIEADGTLYSGELFTSSYCLSPASMLAPDVLRWDETAQRAFRDPWSMMAGMRSPAMSQALYPDLKTHMLEHHWLQNNRTPCNPGFDSVGSYGNCEPYYFNHGWESAPQAVFFDGHVEAIGVREAEQADARAIAQSGRGLWSRDTPQGEDGYFIEYGYDFASTSFHILTTDGIRGRDTVGR